MEKKKADPDRPAFFSNPVLLPQHYQSMEDLDRHICLMEPLKFCQKANIFLFIGKSQNPTEEYKYDQCLQNNFHFLLKEVAEPKFHI